MSPEDLSALEAFVSDDDGKLASLEANVGRFNLFDALGVVQRELAHSNFLAWLLDPAESHGLGSLFLRAFLMDLLRNTPTEHRLFSPIHLDGGELQNIDVRREWRQIDLLITGQTPQGPFVVAIENKIGSTEHSNQLQRYHDTVEADAELGKIGYRQYVYLTPEGDEPSEDNWTVYSYAQLHAVLHRARDTHAGQMGDDVLAFLDHYLRLIRSRLMSDETIESLCREIYKNHRRAIDLIVEHAVTPGPSVLQDVRDTLDEQSDRWFVVSHTGRNLSFVPKPWLDFFPAVSRRPSFDPRAWLVASIYVLNDRCFSRYESFGVTSQADVREAIVIRLIQDRSEFGMWRKKQTVANSWISLGSNRIVKWKEDQPPEDADLLAKIQKRIELMWQQMNAATPILRSILESK